MVKKRKRSVELSDKDSGTISAPFCKESLPFEELLKSDKDIIESLKSFFAESQTTQTLILSSDNQRDKRNFNMTKGQVVGKLCYRDTGHLIDCSRVRSIGVAIPPCVDCVVGIRSDALFILVVQKFSPFYQLLEDRFYNRFPCIIIFANGHPDMATKLFLERLKMELKLPVLAVIGSDPHSMSILSAIPDIKWLGLRPTDMDKFGMNKHCWLPMNNNEIKTATKLLEKEFVKKNPNWVLELELMVKTKHKSEIEALCSFGMQYLTEVYLPLKLQQQDWL